MKKDRQGSSNMVPPPVGSGDTPQLHRLPGLKFQALCRDVLENEPDITQCDVYGINGQAQRGIDLLAHRKDGAFDVAQCKCERDFPPYKIRAASDEFLKHWDHWRSLGVRRFIVLVASDVSRADRQDEIVSQKRRFLNEYGIVYELWPDTRIVNKLRPHPGIVSQHLWGGWAEIICGPNASASLRTALAEKTAFNSHLLLDVESARDEKLILMREMWREGRRDEARGLLSVAKSDDVVWSALAPRLQADFLRFEASIVIEGDNDPARAEDLLNAAYDLCPDRGDARLRAAISLWRGDDDGALAFLNLADTDSLRHFKALVLLMMRQAEAAERLLGQITDETGETFQLRALCHLANRRLGEARLAMQKALEKSPRWVAIQYTAAVIDYFSSLAPVVVPTFIPSWPEPVPSNFVLQDDESRERLRRALDCFRHLESVAPSEDESRRCLEAWQVACLANDLDRQDEFEAEVRRLLGSRQAHHRVLAWGIAAGIKDALQRPAESIRELIIDGKGEPEQALVLAQYYVSIDKPGRALKLLRPQRGRFAGVGALSVWVTWIAQLEALLGHASEALKLVADSDLSELESRLLTSRILLLAKSGDQTAFRENLLASYNALGDPRFLLDFVVSCARTNDWLVAADRSVELNARIRTPEVLRLAALCSYNAQRFSMCLRLLDGGEDLYPQSRLPADLRRMRVQCQVNVGSLQAAVHEAEALAREEPTLASFLGLAQVYVSKGDFRRLCDVARDVVLLDQVPAGVLLRLAGQARWEDKPLSVRLWRRAVSIGVPDEGVVQAVQLGYELGLDHELAELTARVERLGQSGHAGIVRASLEDLVRYADEFRRQTQELNAAYHGAQLPIHLIAPRLNITLSELYHGQLEKNSEAAYLFAQPLVFARAGRRGIGVVTEAQKADYRLNVDITAVLLARHFGFLDEVERTFAPVRLPKELIPCLAVMRDRLAAGQPSRALAYRKILASHQNGHICSAADRVSARDDWPELLRGGWAGLVDQAIEEHGFVVDFLPIVTASRPVLRDELPEEARARVVGLKAVFMALRASGAITTDYYDRIIDRLPSIRNEPGSAMPDLGARLYFRGTVIETLADLDALDVVADRFQVFIEFQEFERLKTEVEDFERNEALAHWVSDLITHLSGAIQAGRYEIISAEALTSIDADDLKGTDGSGDRLLIECLLALVRLQGDGQDRAWIDDRWANSHALAGRTPIVDTVDVLQQLVSRGGISFGRYYETISRMRAEGLCFFPLSKEEILHHVAQLDVRSASETTALRDLRRGLAMSFLASRFLRPGSADGQSSDPGEFEFLIRSSSAVSEALSALWLESDGPHDERLAKAEWVLGNLFVPHYGLRGVASPNAAGDERYAFAVLAASLLTRTVAISGDTSKAESVKAYHRWIFDRFLDRRFQVEPDLLVQTAGFVRRVIEQLRSGHTAESESRVAALVFQRFLLQLPDQVRQEIGRGSDFLSNYGLGIQVVANVSGLQLERTEYLMAAREAINGRAGRAKLFNSDREVTFSPLQPTGAGFTFSHPDWHIEVPVRDPHLGLLADSAAQREAVAEGLRRVWDLPAREFRAARCRYCFN